MIKGWVNGAGGKRVLLLGLSARSIEQLMKGRPIFAAPWRCTVCRNMNPDDATHCRQCDYSRMVMRDGKEVPRDGKL